VDSTRGWPFVCTPLGSGARAATIQEGGPCAPRRPSTRHKLTSLQRIGPRHLTQPDPIHPFSPLARCAGGAKSFMASCTQSSLQAAHSYACLRFIFAGNSLDVCLFSKSQTIETTEIRREHPMCFTPEELEYLHRQPQFTAGFQTIRTLTEFEKLVELGHRLLLSESLRARQRSSQT
jgi:hypothetical protein